MSSRVLNCQVVLAGIERNLLYLHAAYERELEDFLERTHKRLRDHQAEAGRMLDEAEDDPCLSLLSAVRQAQRVKSLVAELGNCSREGEVHKVTTGKLAAVIHGLQGPNHVATASVLGTITCRIDGTKLRVPVGKGLVLVRCPRCRYEFQVNTSLPTWAAHSSDLPRSVWARLRSLWRRRL